RDNASGGGAREPQTSEEEQASAGYEGEYVAGLAVKLNG
ncbi:hypothetical protein ACI1VM_19405, partial [Escherichia coli]